MHNWQILNKFRYNPEKKSANDELIVNLLKNRGILAKKDVESFLHPSLKDITFKSLGINKEETQKAILRIKKAIKNNEKIVVYTDYDADGILSGAILWETLYSLKADCLPFVPDRIKEGYGLSKAGIDKVKKDLNPGLLITVDHGITKVEEVDYAKSKGIDVIIIDHHLMPPILPKAVSIIHTTALCATGLTWIFANFLKGKTMENLLDLVAIGTVADLVPLLGVNRALVKFGIEKINKTRRVGLNALIKISGLKKGEIDSYSLSHILAPRLNASGRLTNAIDSLRLICTTNPKRAEVLAVDLNTVNRNRQNLTKESIQIAVSQVTSSEGIIFVGHESFHQGIIGLIAGKLTEIYKRPAIAVSIGEEFCKASVRSVKGVNIVEFLRKASELLIDIGGHPMAAGFTLRRENLEKLKIKLLSLSDIIIKEENLIQERLIDMELDPVYVDNNLFDEISRLSPFGQGNPQPFFAGFNLNVVNARLVGREQNHLKLTLSSDKNPKKLIQAIGFNQSQIYSSLEMRTQIDIVYQINKDDWNGQNRLILKLRDARLSHNTKKLI